MHELFLSKLRGADAVPLEKVVPPGLPKPCYWGQYGDRPYSGDAEFVMWGDAKPDPSGDFVSKQLILCCDWCNFRLVQPIAWSDGGTEVWNGPRPSGKSCCLTSTAIEPHFCVNLERGPSQSRGISAKLRYSYGKERDGVFAAAFPLPSRNSV